MAKPTYPRPGSKQGAWHSPVPRQGSAVLTTCRTWPASQRDVVEDLTKPLFTNCLVVKFSEVERSLIWGMCPCQRLAAVVALYNTAGLITPPLVKGGAYKAHHPVIENGCTYTVP